MTLSISTIRLLASFGDTDAADAIDCANSFSSFFHYNGMIITVF